MAKMTGHQRHSARLRRLAGPGVTDAVLRGLYVGGQAIELEAERLITEGSVSGAGHVASKPGEPPNADTRALDTSIETVIASRDPPKVTVEVNAPHGLALELGTSKMAERPFMRPAVAAKHGVAAESVAKAMNAIIRRG